MHRKNMIPGRLIYLESKDDDVQKTKFVDKMHKINE